MTAKKTIPIACLTGSATGIEPAALVQGVCQPHEAIRRLGGLPDLYADIVGRLLDDASGVYGRLRMAAQQQDVTEVHTSAHSLKGLALMCGAVSLAEATKGMEDATRPGSTPDLESLLVAIEREMNLARIALTPYR